MGALHGDQQERESELPTGAQLVTGCDRFFLQHPSPKGGLERPACPLAREQAIAGREFPASNGVKLPRERAQIHIIFNF